MALMRRSRLKYSDRFGLQRAGSVLTAKPVVAVGLLGPMEVLGLRINSCEVTSLRY